MALKLTGLRELEKGFRTAAKLVAKGEARAVTRAGTSIIAAQSRAIAQTVNLKIATIKSAIKVVQQPTADSPRMVLEVRFKGLSLTEYGARQINKGVSVMVLRGKRTLLKAAFYSPKSKAFVGRVAKGGDRYGPPHVGRLPIIKLWGPSVYSEFIKPEITKVGADTWLARIEIELERETNFALRSAGIID